MLFGMLTGMVVFSALSAQWAKQELVRYREFQAKKAKAQAEEMAKGLAFSILTENARTYSEDYALGRGKEHGATSGKTRGKQDFIMNVQTDEDTEQFGQSRKTIAITASDDTLLRGQIHRTEHARGLQEISSSQNVVVFDTAEVRGRQVKDSAARMELMGEQVYVFVAAHKKFPTDEEFAGLSGRLGINDAWGQPFAYEPLMDGSGGVLSFTTPWNYTQRLKLSLKDDTTDTEE